jgi:hypothetical protein
LRAHIPGRAGGETAGGPCESRREGYSWQQGRPGSGEAVSAAAEKGMQLKLPSPRRFLSHHAPARPAPRRPEDDPWAGEDAEWQAEEERSHEDAAAFARFFRAVAVAALVGGLFWAVVVLLILRLL